MKKYLVTYLDERDEESKIEVELSPKGKWLTREEVDTLVYQIQEHSKLQNKLCRQTIRRKALDELFGGTP